MTESTLLEASGLAVGYRQRRVIDGLDLVVPPGQVTAIVGANACGKSTLLRAMSRLLSPTEGSVVLDGDAVHRMPAKQLARKLGLLPQAPIAPEGITVADLVSRGRNPHRRMLSRWSRADDEAVAHALEATGTLELSDRAIDELSGGQRQKVWIAMVLAQRTDLLLLDEPTTFLDVSHQVEVLDLLADLNRDRGTTVVMVLHDLNLAARYSDHLIAIADGGIYARGTPHDVLTSDTVRRVFGIDSRIITDPTSGSPLMLPLGRHHMRAEGSGSASPT